MNLKVAHTKDENNREVAKQKNRLQKTKASTEQNYHNNVKVLEERVSEKIAKAQSEMKESHDNLFT